MIAFVFKCGENTLALHYSSGMGLLKWAGLPYHLSYGSISARSARALFVRRTWPIPRNIDPQESSGKPFGFYFSLCQRLVDFLFSQEGELVWKTQDIPDQEVLGYPESLHIEDIV